MQFILKLIPRRQNQNRYGAFLLQFPADLESTHARQIQIEQHQIRGCRKNSCCRILKIRDTAGLIARLLQYSFQFFPHHIFIFYHCYMLHIYSSSISQGFTPSPLIFICSESTPLAPVPSVSEDTGCLTVLQMPYKCILPHRATKS